MRASHARDPGSIPGRRTQIFAFSFLVSFSFRSVVKLQARFTQVLPGLERPNANRALISVASLFLHFFPSHVGRRCASRSAGQVCGKTRHWPCAIISCASNASCRCSIFDVASCSGCLCRGSSDGSSYSLKLWCTARWCIARYRHISAVDCWLRRNERQCCIH